MANHNATIRWFASPGEDFARGSTAGRIAGISTAERCVGFGFPAHRPGAMVRRGGVDPEEAFVAWLSSCHMLFFLDFARRSGVVVTSYEDEAEGVMEKGDDGRVRITKVTLRPKIVFAGGEPDLAALDALHHKAHEACFIANSMTAEVVVEPR